MCGIVEGKVQLLRLCCGIGDSQGLAREGPYAVAWCGLRVFEYGHHSKYCNAAFSEGKEFSPPRSVAAACSPDGKSIFLNANLGSSCVVDNPVLPRAWRLRKRNQLSTDLTDIDSFPGFQRHPCVHPISILSVECDRQSRRGTPYCISEERLAALGIGYRCYLPVAALLLERGLDLVLALAGDLAGYDRLGGRAVERQAIHAFESQEPQAVTQLARGILSRLDELLTRASLLEFAGEGVVERWPLPGRQGLDGTPRQRLYCIFVANRRFLHSGRGCTCRGWRFSSLNARARHHIARLEDEREIHIPAKLLDLPRPFSIDPHRPEAVFGQPQVCGKGGRGQPLPLGDLLVVHSAKRVVADPQGPKDAPLRQDLPLLQQGGKVCHCRLVEPYAEGADPVHLLPCGDHAQTHKPVYQVRADLLPEQDGALIGVAEVWAGARNTNLEPLRQEVEVKGRLLDIHVQLNVGRRFEGPGGSAA